MSVFERAEGLLSRGDRVLAAVSGGADSVAMAHHLIRIGPRKGLFTAVLHVHHGLRGREADRDARLVERLAAQWKVPFVLEEARVGDIAARERRSLEDAGRKARYRAIASAARRLRCGKAATGHHLDDQAETVLLHLLRGTRAKGLAGIPAARALREGGPAGRRILVIRPMLAVTRKETEAYCRAYGLPFRKDKTNDSPRFTRNWVRRKVIPLLESRNPRIREHLAAIAKDLRAIL